MRRDKGCPAAQGGVAIVLAMGIVALAAVAAAAILTAQSTWARRVELGSDKIQAGVLARAGIDWARAVLGDDARASSIDHLGEPWALRLSPIPIDNGSLDGYIEDQQGKFNLNNLLRDGAVDSRQMACLRRLLAGVQLSESLADNLAEWMHAEGGADGMEGDYHPVRGVPRRVAGRALTDLAELALVAGFGRDVRERLRPFVSALPVVTPVNVNTASAEVLSSVVDGLGIDGARAVVVARERAYFRDRADFVSRLPRGALPAEDSVVAVRSDYFLARARVTMGRAEATGTALLARQGQGWPMIVWYKAL